MSLTSLIGETKIIQALTPQADATGRTGRWLSMAGIGRCLVLVHITQGDAATVQVSLEQATNVSGANAKGLGQDAVIWANLDVSAGDALVKQGFGTSFATDAALKSKLIVFDCASNLLDMNSPTPFTHIAVATSGSNAANITQSLYVAYALR